MTIEMAILIAGGLLLAAALSSRLADRIGVPSLLLFLLVGMLAGSQGLGRIDFNDPQLAQALGSLALMVILFAGGLDTDWKSVKPVLAPGVVLATVGVILPRKRR